MRQGAVTTTWKIQVGAGRPCHCGRTSEHTGFADFANCEVKNVLLFCYRKKLEIIVWLQRNTLGIQCH